MPGRMTRAKAAVVAEKLHIDEDAVLDLPSSPQKQAFSRATPERDGSERAPLGEIAPNSAESKLASDDLGAGKGTSTGVKKGEKRAAAVRKAGQDDALRDSMSGVRQKLLGQEVGMRVEMPAVMVDEREATSSPASEAAAEDLIKDMPEREVEMSHLPVDDVRPQSPLSPAVRLTRSQMANQDGVPPKTINGEVLEKSLKSHLKELKLESPTLSGKEDALTYPMESMASVKTLALTKDEAEQGPAAEDMPASPPASGVPKAIQNLRKDTPGMRSTSNKENVEPASPAPTIPAEIAPPQSIEISALGASPQQEANIPRRTSEDAIDAIDALEDAVDKVNDSLPKVQPLPEKRKVKRAPSVRTTKAVEARLSLARGGPDSGKGPVLGRMSSVRQSATVGRNGSVRAAPSTRTETATVKPRVTSTTYNLFSSTKPAAPVDTDSAPAEKARHSIPHSKPRPVSLSFPTPPPPPKSTKAPTKSTFHLPGEAIAAKLKAAREARQPKESEDAEKRATFKARPVPAALKKAPSVRQTASSRARESLMNPGAAKVGDAAGAGVKRVGSVKPNGAGVKRDSTVLAHRRPSTVPAVKVPSTSVMDRLSVAKRQSTLSAAASRVSSLTTSKPRVSSAKTPNAPSITAAGEGKPRVPSSKGTLKGKEVLSRAKHALESVEKDKREKEDVAKKARSAAAGQGRAASRDWAERQKAKKLGCKVPAKEDAAIDASAVKMQKGGEDAVDVSGMCGVEAVNADQSEPTAVVDDRVDA